MKIIENSEIPELTQLILNNYNYRIESFLRYFSESHQIKIGNGILKESKKLGKVILKNYMLMGDLEFTLFENGYKLFDEKSIDELDLENDINFLESILSGKILIGFLENYEKTIIVTKNNNVGEMVTGIISDRLN